MSNRPTYDIEPEPPPRQKVIRTNVLEYEPRPRDRMYVVPTWAQFLFGIVFPYVYWGAFVFLLGGSEYLPVLSLVGLVVFIAVISYLRFRLDWTGMTAGLLCSILGLPLVGVLTCGLIMSAAMR